MPAPVVRDILAAAYPGGTQTLERTGTDVSLEIAVSEALDEPTPCEASVHKLGTHGHAPEQFASFLFIPACGCDRLLCKAWLDYAYSGEFTNYKCSNISGCGKSTPLSQAAILPLDITT